MKNTTLTQSDLWLINTKKSKKCNPKTLRIGEIVVCHMEPLFTYPFIGRIRQMSQSSCIVEIIKTCDLHGPKKVSDCAKSVNLAKVLNVSFKNIQRIEDIVFDDVSLRLDSYYDSITKAKAQQEAHKTKIETTKRLIVQVKSNQEIVKNNSKITARELVSLNDAYKESLKWRNSEESRDLQINISNLKYTMTKNEDRQSALAQQLIDHDNTIKKSQVAIGRISLEIDEQTAYIKEIHAMEGFEAKAS